MLFKAFCALGGAALSQTCREAAPDMSALSKQSSYLHHGADAGKAGDNGRHTLVGQENGQNTFSSITLAFQENFESPAASIAKRDQTREETSWRITEEEVEDVPESDSASTAAWLSSPLSSFDEEDTRFVLDYEEDFDDYPTAFSAFSSTPSSSEEENYGMTEEVTDPSSGTTTSTTFEHSSYQEEYEGPGHTNQPNNGKGWDDNGGQGPHNGWSKPSPMQNLWKQAESRLVELLHFRHAPQ